MRSIHYHEQVITNPVVLFEALAKKPACVRQQMLNAAGHDELVLRHAAIDSVANSQSMRLSPCLTASIMLGQVGGQRALMAPVGVGECAARHFAVLVEVGADQAPLAQVMCESAVTCSRPVAQPRAA